MGPWIQQEGGNLACISPKNMNNNNKNYNLSIIKGSPTPGQGCLFNNSNDISTTHAQQNFVIEVTPSDEISETQYIWTGDLWQQAPDGIKGHEGQFWTILNFDQQGNILPVKHIDNFTINM